MTFTELMGLANGNYIETAGTSAKNQCVDLANAYIRYVLGLPIIEFTNAVDFPSKAGTNYDYILNTPTGVPDEGDLVIWGGAYGHIAIFIEGDTNKFTSFDENFPTGSPCHVQEHNYDTPQVLGWLHPKVEPQDQQALIDELRIARDKNWDLYNEVLGQLQGAKEENKALREGLDKIAELLECPSDTASIIGKVKELVNVEDNLTKAQEKIKELTQEGVDDQKKIDDLEKAIDMSNQDANSRLKALGDATEALTQCQNELVKYVEGKEVAIGFFQRLFNWLLRR